MKKVLVYSHDTYGLGNIRRTLSICKALYDEDPEISILMITGSPVIHRFPVAGNIDYVKLPCLTRTDKDGYASKFLGGDSKNLIRLRADIIFCTTANFKPDVILVDKKPYGVQNELQSMLAYVKEYLPQTRISLILRDILDNPMATRMIWEKNGLFEGIERFYDEVLVLGLSDIFDPRKEYEFSSAINKKVKFCGYIDRELGLKTRTEMRMELKVGQNDPLVLVTAGGGEDGTRIFETYLEGLRTWRKDVMPHSLLVFGPEMDPSSQRMLQHQARQLQNVQTLTFTDDLMSYMNAADLTVSMGGYGTVCEILTLNKSAVVIPRVSPVEEQWIRADRMSQLGLFTCLHPDELTPKTLMRDVFKELGSTEEKRVVSTSPFLGGIFEVTKAVTSHLRATMRQKHIEVLFPMTGSYREQFDVPQGHVVRREPSLV